MLIRESHLGGENVGIELTSIGMIHPETAKLLLFDSLHVVIIMPKRPSKIKVENSGNNTLKKQLSSSTKELGDKLSTDENDSRYAVVRIVFSESVAKGHLMLSQSLCRYMRVSFHSWIYMQKYVNDLKKDAPTFSLSPCQFVMVKNSQDAQNNDADLLADNSNLEGRLSLHQLSRDLGGRDSSSQEELVSILFDSSAETTNEESGSYSAKERLKGLLYSWIVAQLHAISSMAGVKATSLVLGPTTFIRFKLTTDGCLSGDKWQPSTDSLRDAAMREDSVNDILYVLKASGESLPGQKYNAYELAIGEQVTSVHDFLRVFSENLSTGSFVSYDTCKAHVLNHVTTSSISSLSWMGTAASDVINSRAYAIVISCLWHMVL